MSAQERSSPPRDATPNAPGGRDGATLELARDVSAVILAGGLSRRMGRPKAWLPLGGAPLLVQVAARVRPLVREIVVVGAADAELPSLAARVVRDHEPDRGPLPALALGLATITTPYAFALGCDGAFVRRAILRLLADVIADASAAVPVWDGEVQPLVALYHRRLAAPLDAAVAAGERRLQSVAALPDVRLVPAEDLRVHDAGGLSFRTLNTPAEYAAAERDWPALAHD